MSLQNHEFWLPRRALPTIAMQLLLLPALTPSLGWSIPLLTLITSVVALSNHQKTLPVIRLNRRWINTLVLVSFGVWWSAFPSKLTLEPAVGLLLLGASLKLIEVRAPRDAYVLIFSNIALLASLFLFDQSLWATITALVVLWLALAALVEINKTVDEPKSLTRKVIFPVTILVGAIPMTLVWFLIFPRVAPLWAIPVLGESVKMGMSDTLRPGDVADLGRDASVAFRVEFTGDMPNYSELYWRGITLGAFENGSWRQHNHLKETRNASFATRLSTTKSNTSDAVGTYKVFQTASQRSWLYQLNPSATADDHAKPLLDNTYQTRWPITSDLETSYTLLNVTAGKTPPTGSANEQALLALEMVFPSDLNPRSLALAQQLMVPGNSQESVLRTLNWFRTQPLIYTLQPDLISESNFVDRFLFETQSGFCEHFAYSFVALMRLMEIPARIVGGYMGGEINPLNGTVTVRELDAHAWAEVWLEDMGWVRVDPTATVAPDRIEQGSLESLQGTPGFLSSSPLSLLRLRDWHWVNQMRLELDAINYRWQSGVMSYQQAQQSELLTNLLGQITASKILAMLALGLGLSLLPVALLVGLHRYKHWRQPKYRAYRRLARTLSVHGIERHRGETLRQASQRARLLPKTDASKIEAQLAHFEETWYGTTE